MSKKILIVEDNKTDANNLGQFLEDENCTIDFAFTGFEAIKNIDANNYSLIFLNLNMPDINGNEILAKIRENKLPNILPVIMLGTLNELDEKTLLGADDIITKPFTRIIVKTKVQNLLRLQNKTDELERQIEEYKQLAERLDDVNRKLVESETRFRMISDYCNDWEMFRDPQNKILYCSPAIERILGYTTEEYTNLSFAEVIYPEDFQKAMLAHGTLTQKGERVEPITFRLVKKNREVIWVEVFGQPVYTPDGRHIGARASTRDISKIKSAEFALKESEEKYKNLFQFMDEGLLRADNEGHIILANDAVAKMFGYNSPAEILGKPTTILYPAETREKLANELKRVHQVFNFEVHTRTKQGKEMYLLCNAKDNINEKGEVSGREGILRDITDLKMIELELRKSEAKLKEANSTKDKFISILAHDLRSPFNALIGFSELLKEDFEDYSTEEIKSFIDNIYNVSTSTFSFLNELLEWASTQRDMVAFNPENIHLFEIENECISHLSNVSKAKNIGIQCSIPPDLFVFADRNMLKTILRNLISNSIKFTPKFGHVSVSASINPSCIEISVSDTGIGMDANTLQSLFKIGKTKSIKGTEGERGTGFGLLLCKEFVEKHGGTIWAESELGKRSDFKFTIPMDTN